MKKKYFSGKTFFITGSSKNCGKTTYLNYFCDILRNDISFARLTVGIDGERQDRLFGNKKPGVYVYKDDIFITTDDEITKSGIDHSILEVFPYKTVAGRIVLCKANRFGRVELIGPEKNDQLAHIIDICKEYCDTVFVDGALNRTTQMSGIENSLMIYVKFIHVNTLNKDLEEIDQIRLKNDIKKVKENDKYIFFQGAFTEKLFKSIEKDMKICVEDITRLFLNKNTINDLVDQNRLIVKNKIPLYKIILNVKGVSEKDIEKKLNKTDFFNYIEFNPYMVRR